MRVRSLLDDVSAELSVHLGFCACREGRAWIHSGGLISSRALASMSDREARLRQTFHANHGLVSVQLDVLQVVFLDGCLDHRCDDAGELSVEWADP